MTTLAEIENLSVSHLHDRIHQLEQQLEDLDQQEAELQELKFALAIPEAKHPKVAAAIAKKIDSKSQLEIDEIRANLNLDRTPLEVELAALKKLQGKKNLLFQLQEMKEQMSTKVWEANNKLKEAFEEVEKLGEMDAAMLILYLDLTEQIQADPLNLPAYGWIARNWRRFRFHIEKNSLGGFEPFRK